MLKSAPKVRGEIKPKNGPEGDGRLQGLLNHLKLLSGGSKSLDIPGYYFNN